MYMSTEHNMMNPYIILTPFNNYQLIVCTLLFKLRITARKIKLIQG